MTIQNKTEFSLTIRKYKDKNHNRGNQYGYTIKYEEPDWEEYETLDFKSLSAIEVLRKLMDYITNK